MTDEERLSQMLQQGLPLWEPEQRLEQVTQEDVRFSRGFLACRPERLIDGFVERWLPLLLTLESEVQVTSCVARLGAPKHYSWRGVVTIDDEIGTLCFDEALCQAIASRVVGNEVGPLAAELAAEYLARRFLYSLQKSLTVEPQPTMSFISNPGRSPQSEIGSIDFSFEINGVPCTLSVGLGVRAVETLDAAWRNYVTRQTLSRGMQYSDQLHSVSIELAELAVEPSVLIDYVRSGTVVDLERPVSPSVLVRLNEIPWCKGSLAVFRGCFVVRLQDFSVEQREVEDGKTRVRVEIARFQIDQEGVIENEQRGAIITSRVPATGAARMIIGGEQVAAASIHDMNGNFALTILAR